MSASNSGLVRRNAARRGRSSSCIQTSGTYEQLQEYVDAMLEQLRDYPGLDSIETDLQLNMPEFRIEMDRAKVADLGLDVTVVGRTLETLLGGRQVTRFEQNGEQYDVIVQLAAEDRASPQTLSTIFLRSPTRRHGPALQHRQGQGGGGAQGAQALQPAARGDDLGQPRRRAMRWAMPSPSWSRPRARCCPRRC